MTSEMPKVVLTRRPTVLAGYLTLSRMRVRVHRMRAQAAEKTKEAAAAAEAAAKQAAEAGTTMQTPAAGTPAAPTPSDTSSEKDDGFALRYVATFFEKYERYELQELLANAQTHYLLSTEDMKVPTDPPTGVIANMLPIGNTFSAVLLIPEDPELGPADMREVHQIIRELTFGIYALNQTPQICLEANCDESTACQLPPAYIDTRVGQILIAVDYMMKSMWHGAYFPKEKRTKFSERWRSNVDTNPKKPLLTEFTSAGLIDITRDPDYADIYDRIPVEQPGDSEMLEDRRFFMSHVDDLAMNMTLCQNSIQQHKHMFVADPNWTVSSVVRLTEDRLDHTGYERLNARLQLHEIMIRQHIENKYETRKQIYLLKLISFLTPFMIAMKKRMRVPDLNKMLPNMAGDETKTERELPPLMLGDDFKCPNFSFGNHFFHLHGGINVEYETPNPKKAAPELVDSYEHLLTETSRQMSKWLDPCAPMHDGFPIPVYEIGGKRYHAFQMDFETYYPQSPQKPKWVHAMCEESAKLRVKRQQISEIQIHEMFKKLFGYKKAIKYKSVPQGQKAAARRGLVALFVALCRKHNGPRLAKQDETGLSLVHWAAIMNRPQIIAYLLLQSMDINVRRNNTFLSQGPTPLHLAARCGSLDAVCCLVAARANVLATDDDGWAPVHHAAYFNQEHIVKLMVRKSEGLMELTAKNELKSTPILLAASSGALSVVRVLIDMGANLLRTDDEGNNVVHLAALRFHTNVLEFFIQWDHPDINVWQLLVGMLRSEDMRKKDSAVKCLEVMATSDPDHWRAILEADGVPALVECLRVDNEELQAVAASVLCQIAPHDPIRQALTRSNSAKILIQLLASPIDDIQSRAAIVISHLAHIDDNQRVIAEQGGIPALVNLLDSEVEHVLVNAVNAIHMLCIDNHDNQTAMAQHGGLEPLVEFLTVNSDILQAEAAGTIAAVTRGHKDNQDAVVAEGAVEPIVNLIKGRVVNVQVKAAAALEALSENNPASQKAFLDLDAPKAIMRLFIKLFDAEVKEQGACALWSLAGHTKTQQKYMGERISIPHLIEMLLSTSEKLQYVGSMGMTALGREDIDNQNRIAEQNGIQPLVRLLRSPKTSLKVLLIVIRTLGVLCVGVAHRNNRVTQRKIAEDGGITRLVQLLVAPPTIEIQVEVAYSLGCVVLGHRENQEKLSEEPGFRFDLLLDLLSSQQQHIRLKAGFALTIFAFNNTPQQFAIREAGGIRFHCFESFLDSEDEYRQCHAAFQIVVLARVIVDHDQVSLTALGVTKVTEVLRSDDDNAVILAASLMSSLAHTRAGIPDAMMTVGAIELLIQKLYSDNEQVRFACATALGYLTYNRMAARRLLVSCRNTPGLYDQITENIGKNPKVCKDFTEEFRTAKLVGLPCLSLEVNGGPPAVPAKKKGQRPKTSVGYRSRMRVDDDDPQRSISAPAAFQRARSAGPSRARSHTTTPETPQRLLRTEEEKLLPRRPTTPGACIKSKMSAWSAKPGSASRRTNSGTKS